MTVEELMKELEKVKDKDIKVVFDYHGSELDVFSVYEEGSEVFKLID